MNDNETNGIINNEIKIAIGDDLNHLTTVKTFSNLEEITTLEYIFPEFEKTKYIAVICNLNPLFYASLAEVEAYEQFAEAIPAFAPLKLTGWNHDVIVEALPANTHATHTIDTQGWAFYTSNIQPQGALSDDSRIVRSNTGVEYLLNDYTQSNALVLKPYDRRTLTLTEPVACEELHFLMVSSNGRATLYTTVSYDDNTSESQNVMIADWYRSTPDGTEAVYGLGRVKVGTTDEYYNNQLSDQYKFRLFETMIPTDKTKKVKSITFYSNNYASWGTVLAISKKGTAVTTGISNVNANETTKQVVGIYNLNGIRLNTPAKGINIFKYADGTTRKVWVK